MDDALMPVSNPPDPIIETFRALIRLLARQAAAEIAGAAQPTYALGTDTAVGVGTTPILISTST